ncbi:predicted protein [Plenodomus lingam JN3]|uniref:Predicted protein n=1 Tax=Leptosphaeria maculans (strain JN3 / isolate v23.1.3 / race Av1-4-5-6-7-8) TaxID=985895 RepID=E5ABP6_LEPMJ|nr:predicted protein [Plenodomus lingam JN3]CBY01087.1 predicted protein [Plenodomus lingam JN3]
MGKHRQEAKPVRKAVRQRRIKEYRQSKTTSKDNEFYKRGLQVDVSSEDIEEELQLSEEKHANSWYDPDKRKAINQESLDTNTERDSPKTDIKAKMAKVKRIIQSFNDTTASRGMSRTQIQSGLTHSLESLLSIPGRTEGAIQTAPNETENEMLDAEQLLTWYAQSLNKCYDALISIHESR